MQEYIELSLVKHVQLKTHFLRLLTAICFPKIFARIVKNVIIHLLVQYSLVVLEPSNNLQSQGII